MNLQVVGNLSDQIKQKENRLDEIEDAGGPDFIPEKSPEWMAVHKSKIQLKGQFYLLVNEGSEIQYNKEKTGFRVVTKENRDKKFW